MYVAYRSPSGTKEIYSFQYSVFRVLKDPTAVAIEKDVFVCTSLHQESTHNWSHVINSFGLVSVEMLLKAITNHKDIFNKHPMMKVWPLKGKSKCYRWYLWSCMYKHSQGFYKK